MIKWQYNLALALGALALVLAIANGFVSNANRQAQLEVNARHQYLQQTAQLESLYRELVKALAEQAAKNNDTQIMQMLASQGINVTVNPTAADAATAKK